MYEERKRKFDWKGFLLKLIIVILLFFVGYRLFTGVKTNTLYDQIYNDNLTTMKEAAKAYYTTDRLPENIGDSETMTLQEMLNDKLLVEFADKDGNSCDTFGSYVTVTKIESDKYTLKVQLACGDHIDYILDTIGCYDVCDDNCEEEQVTEYEFKRAITNTKEVTGCKSGYKLSGNACYKVVKTNYIAAEKEYYEDTTIITDSKISTGSSYNVYTDKVSDTEKVYVDNIEDEGKTTVECADSSYTLSDDESICTKEITTTVDNPQVCNWVPSGTEPVRSCDTCAITIKIIYSEKCTDGGTSEVPKTLTATPVTTTEPSTYSCPTGYTPEGDETDSDLKCYKEVTVYSCPAGFSSEGSGSNLTCYKTIEGEDTEYCADFGADLINHKCYKKVTGSFKGYTCPTGYILDGSKCYKKTTDKTSTITINKTITTYEYKWSTETELEGWTRTGNTRLVDASLVESSDESDSLIDEIKDNSDQEVTERIDNVTANSIDKTDILYIVIASIIAVGFIYLFIMFLTGRRNSK